MHGNRKTNGLQLKEDEIMADKHQVLKHYFGHDSFRIGQETVIDCILSGSDVLAVMPTGAGKSVCYQVPALIFPGITLVVSPLISLMKDQVAALKQMGIPAAYINSSLEPNQVTKVLQYARQGRYKIIYVAPERLSTREFRNFCFNAQISLVAVDEAHCVSQWGPDFRPHYLKIAEFINSFSTRPVVGAFTATATPQVKKDILELLQLRKPKTVTTGFDRPNLYFSVIEPADKNKALLSLLKKRRDKAGIIYCSTRKSVEEICFLLDKNNFSATRYHAGLEDEERKNNQEDFVYDRKQIMVATNAFGMGIDKSDVSFVIHYNMPKDLESYYQEAGRAGRDGSEAECILLYSSKDIRTIKYFIEHSRENEELTEEELQFLKERQYERLNCIIAYCTAKGCLRSYILRYFGDECPEFCYKCSGCTAGFEVVDVTVEAQKIMSCVIKTKQVHGRRMIADVLRGKTTKKLVQAGLQTQSTYSIMSGYSRQKIYDIIDGLVTEGYMEASLDQYKVLRVLPKSRNVLYANEKVTVRLRKEHKPQNKLLINREVTYDDARLLSALKIVRREIAKAANVPAFVVFSDATIIDMSRKKPTTQEEFLKVSGVGAVKYQRYGEVFLKTISRFKEESSF